MHRSIDHKFDSLHEKMQQMEINTNLKLREFDSKQSQVLEQHSTRWKLIQDQYKEYVTRQYVEQPSTLSEASDVTLN